MLNDAQKMMLCGLVCPYCKKPSEKQSAQKYFGGKAQGWVWSCAPCKAYEFATPDGSQAVGRLAKKELRDLRQKARQKFESLQHIARQMPAQIWAQCLTDLGIPSSLQNINFLSEETIKKALDWADKERKKLIGNEAESVEWWWLKI